MPFWSVKPRTSWAATKPSATVTSALARLSSSMSATVTPGSTTTGVDVVLSASVHDVLPSLVATSGCSSGSVTP